MKKTDEIIELLKNPNITYKEIGQRFGVTKQHVQQVCKRAGIERTKPTARDVLGSILRETKKITIEEARDISSKNKISIHLIKMFTKESGIVLTTRKRELINNEMKECCYCKEIKSIDEFHKYSNKINAYCISCYNMKANLAYHRKAKRENRPRRIGRRLLHPKAYEVRNQVQG